RHGILLYPRRDARCYTTGTGKLSDAIKPTADLISCLHTQYRSTSAGRPLPVYFSSRHYVSGSCLPDRNLNSAAHAIWCEHEINLASQLVRNEIAYEIGAIAGLGLGFHRRAIELLPDQRQISPISVQLTVPVHRYLAARNR